MRMWRITSILYRHDGVFAFLRKDEGNKITMKYVRLEPQPVFSGNWHRRSMRTSGDPADIRYLFNDTREVGDEEQTAKIHQDC